MSESKNIRVRFAPSPTGHLHVGGARTAIFNWLFARHHGGTFILRIEDTDRIRSTHEATQGILDSMKWLGLDWDEGPYFQSERLDLYKQKTQELIEAGKAYYEEDPEKGRAIKFRVTETLADFHDEVHGPIKFDARLIKDFVIQKSDGFPTYNFACVVDDTDMGITHIIRGDDHISNTPRQILLYKAFGYEPPKFAHVPMILGEDGTRLSKRHGAVSVMEYERLGFLSDALFNFLALLGWSPGKDQEIVSREECIENFDVHRIRKTASRFNMEKLRWMNAEYIRKTPIPKLREMLAPFVAEAGIDFSKFSADYIEQVIRFYIERFNTLRDFADVTVYVFRNDFEYDEAAVKKFLSDPEVLSLLAEIADLLESVPSFTTDSLKDALQKFIDEKGIKFRKISQPLRVAVTGRTVSPELFGTMVLIGRERVIQRIRKFAK